MGKMKTMKLSQYYEVRKPIYEALKITPHSGIRNYNSSDIAKMVAGMYKSIAKSIKRIEKKFVIETSVKCSYVIDITKQDVSFYFVVPRQYKIIAKEKISSVWPQATIEESEVPSIKGDNTITYKLGYKNLDAFSLKVDKKSNGTLNNVLNVLDIMETDDRVSICYNFVPCSQYSWRAECKTAHEKYRDNNPIQKEFGSVHIVMGVVNAVITVVESILEGLGSDIAKGSPFEQMKFFLSARRKEVSELSMKKANGSMIQTQIAVVSSSNDIDRANNNAVSVCQGFRSLDADNELIYHRSKPIQLLDYKFKNVEALKTSTDECQNFLQVPGRELLEMHKIKHSNILETKVPEELLNGYIKMGKSTYKGNTVQTYFSSDTEIANLPFIMLGPMGAGKTFEEVQQAKDVIKANEGLVVIDYIKNCEVADSIAAITPKERLVVLDLSKEEGLQSFAYNEYKLQGNTVFERIESANLHQQQVTALIDAVYVGDPLSGQMRKFFTSAADIVLINDNMSLKDVVQCLENHEIRNKFIESIPNEYICYLEDQVSTIKQLDDFKETKIKDKDTEGKEITKVVRTVEGTKYNKIEHIMDRVNSLREDLRMRMMFNKPCSENIDFADEMDKGKVILIKMPADKFRSAHTRNVLTTFFISKIWLACNIRGVRHKKPLRYHLMLDEIFQAPTAYKPLSNILRECRKFQLRLVFTAHQLADLGDLQSGLKSAGASYMLMQKTDKANFKYLEQEFSQHGFTVDDLLNLRRYHALNLVSYSKGYAAYESDLEVK